MEAVVIPQSDDGAHSKRQRLSDVHCHQFSEAVAALKAQLRPASPQASAVYHLAFVKAFVQVSCKLFQSPARSRSLHIELAAALDDMLLPEA